MMLSDTIRVSGNKALLKIAINDANLFIDLWEVDLLELFFQMPLELHTTNLIINELEPNQKEKINHFIEKGLLQVRNLTRDEIESLGTITVNSKKLSPEDLSVYYYATEIGNCMILTGDNRLKKEAQRQGFEVHGILWVFEQMVENGLLDKIEACHKLKDLIKVNLWLPIIEYERMMSNWET